MKTVKTRRGKTLNMAQLAAQNETARAISNVPINARGDIIDNRGNVKVPKEKISKEYDRDNLQEFPYVYRFNNDDLRSILLCFQNSLL